ncbi:MAG: bifunctional protein-serine/threonine kinase/phosphatase [Opitutaceae bacterium]
MNVQSSGHAVPRTEGAACDDAWMLRERGDALVAALADGIGSSREGGAAAHRAVEMLADYCLARPRAWSPRRALAEFSAQINRHLYSESMERYGQPELACTLSAVLLEGGRLYGCNIGDSPVFHWRRGRLQRLSEAHVLAQQGLDHVLTRALGLEAGVDPFFFETELVDGDLVLICSDGITAALTEDRLNELLSRRATARSLVGVARTAIEQNPELSDDTSAIVLEILDRGHVAVEARQRLEVLRTLRAGDAIDSYFLSRSLDASNRVWLAKNAGGTRVALKFPPLDAADNPPLRDAFVREAWNATRLVSPDLVRAWTPESGSLRYYAMEYIDAPTLRATLRTARLGVEEVRELGQFLLRVGQFLLQHDLAHSDIKPENILVVRAAESTTFRLLDLGSAAEIFSVTSRAGTPSYLAPERFRGGALSERTEIFAIGVTLYEALTGTYPYGEVERFQTPRFDTAARRPTKLNPSIPPWLEAVVLRAIDPDLERRYQNFSEFAYDLAHPSKVAAHHRKDAGLIERNPLLFYKLLCTILVAVVIWLLVLLNRRQ